MVPATPLAPGRVFEVPEVLELVLANLTQRHLALSASLVCRRWNGACRRLMRVPVEWNDSMDLIELLTRLDRLGHAHTLRCSSTATTSSINTVDLHREQLFDRLAQLSDIATIPLRRLILRGYYEFGFLLQTLPFLGSLTKLQFENLTGSFFEMEFVLRACVNLTYLSVDASNARQPAYFTPLGRTVSTRESAMIHGTCGMPRFRMKQLRLRKFALDQTMLVSLLPSLPGLAELRIEGVRVSPPPAEEEEQQQEQQEGTGAAPTWTPFDRGQFYDSVALYCPELRAIQLSIKGEPAERQDIVDLARFLPKVHNWSFDFYDLTGVSTMSTIHSYTNRLTSLEISNGPPLWRSDLMSNPPAEAIHRFLCESPQLLHFKAPGFAYPAALLGLTPVDHGRIVGLSTTPTTQGEATETLSPFWACRNLRTLDLRIRAKSMDSKSPLFSRQVFAYISLVCPKLETLSLHHPFLNLTLEGGFCLLAKLDRLRWLKLEVPFSEPFDTRNFVWMRQCPTLNGYTKLARLFVSPSSSSSSSPSSPSSPSSSSLPTDEVADTRDDLSEAMTINAPKPVSSTEWSRGERLREYVIGPLRRRALRMINNEQDSSNQTPARMAVKAKEEKQLLQVNRMLEEMERGAEGWYVWPELNSFKLLADLDMFDRVKLDDLEQMIQKQMPYVRVQVQTS